MESETNIPSKRTTPPQQPMLTLELPNVAYTFAWLFVVAFHAACGTYLIGVAMTYWYLSNGMMSFYVSFWSLTGIQGYRFYGFVFGVVGGMHALQVMHLIILSIRSKCLMLRSESSILQHILVERVLSSRLGHSAMNLLGGSADSSYLSRAFGIIWNTVFSRKGILGVESEHFSTVFACREVLEASSQTYQAYRASNLMPHPELNSLIVTLLVINCWSTAATQYSLRNTPALERVMTLTFDALISFGIMIFVPLIIFIPYLKQFDTTTGYFTDSEYLFDPVTMSDLVLENRLIFAAGLFDFGTKLVPQLSIILSLVTVSELIGRYDVKVTPGADEMGMQSMAVKPKTSFNSIEKPGATQKIAASRPPRSSGYGGCLRVLHKWKHPIVIGLFILWGAIILLFHGLAAQRAASYETVGCRAETRPWFSNGKEPCSSLVYDCHTLGTDSPDESSFDKLDHVVLATLVIAHCPAIRMPLSFQSLNNLMLLQIYNSTIVSWDVESSVSATKHSRMLSVLIGRTQMIEFPQGILQPLPSTLISIQFSETNLTTLPDDLYQRWHALAAVAFENGILTEIPYQTFFMPLFALSFMGNRIETIPTLAMMPPGMIIADLRLNKNPLKELPATLMAPNALVMSLNVQDTELTFMPDWVKTQTQVVWASSTPFCQVPMTDPTLAYQVMCFPRPAIQESFFPMKLFERLYPFDGELLQR